MKLIVINFALLLSAIHINAQKPKFKPLHDPKNHAGCYVESGNKIIGNLSEEDSLGRNIALFNVSGKDENFLVTQGTQKYPVTYQNGSTKIFIKQTTTRKEPNTCLEYQLYKVKLVQKKKAYFYTFKGFCGC
ncbi:hypothetical protein LV89_00120 [Arcicella aurantiaca]|uniref:Uncharacterized protein n=1 Tax=Arcicella aurantiaca TaxID=591202 RepID=A0A316EFC0_9BACT|nr:hypothetical protein [Arcicella aurantiaca]PWK29280.1 hypothetical protein LV89_00120 [Arcicella aurantiaca]